ncbi:hypothetical protein ACGFS9_14955 [Streptomyces sp. NPDC048566]|uniref:hypothetical protein n=1 Tax=Streptomyces sp. NPDC048566 TaxID=3365569 RepID=UPI00371C8875
MSDAEPEATCPSSSCSPGHLLLGIVRPDGTLAALRPPPAVDAAFVERATAAGSRPPEARFRFAGPCVTGACHHWSDQRCRLGDAVARAAPLDADDAPPPPCAIRSTCRWWSQTGRAACRVCPRVVHTPAPAPAGTRTLADGPHPTADDSHPAADGPRPPA